MQTKHCHQNLQSTIEKTLNTHNTQTGRQTVKDTGMLQLVLDVKIIECKHELRQSGNQSENQLLRPSRVNANSNKSVQRRPTIQSRL